MKQVVEPILNLEDQAYLELAKFITGFFEDFYEFISYFTKCFYKVFGTKSEAFFVMITVIVRFIIVIALVIDVFIFFKLNYFYKCLYLLCIPLIINIIFFFLRDMAKKLEEVRSLLIITDITENTATIPSYIFELSPGNEELDLNYLITEFYMISKITDYLEVYDQYCEYIIPRFNIINYSLYLICWIYVLIVNFLYFYPDPLFEDLVIIIYPIIGPYIHLIEIITIILMIITIQKNSDKKNE